MLKYWHFGQLLIKVRCAFLLNPLYRQRVIFLIHLQVVAVVVQVCGLLSLFLWRSHLFKKEIIINYHHLNFRLPTLLLLFGR